ncbi:hypothetical protein CAUPRSCDRAFT_11037 [Caulochytrium protostelioides]|uniref:Uncharacterized protein n=1 Tax=Caulochytrium protostelioides TaxID=1555241 RepID=A0A4P9WXP5_9FUNG|nr:hypothetical protein CAUPRSCDRAFT_11037 [Caulochytrium protostelioides]
MADDVSGLNVAAADEATASGTSVDVARARTVDVGFSLDGVAVVPVPSAGGALARLASASWLAVAASAGLVAATGDQTVEVGAAGGVVRGVGVTTGRACEFGEVLGMKVAADAVADAVDGRIDHVREVGAAFLEEVERTVDAAVHRDVLGRRRVNDPRGSEALEGRHAVG